MGIHLRTAEIRTIPRLQPLLERIAKEETDPKLRQNALDLIAATRKVEEAEGTIVGTENTHLFWTLRLVWRVKRPSQL